MRKLFIALAGLVALLGFVAPAAATGKPSWNLTSMCRPDDSHGQIRVTGPAGGKYTLRLVGGDWSTKGIVPDSGEAFHTVPWNSSSDTWKLIYKYGEKVKAIGDNDPCEPVGPQPGDECTTEDGSAGTVNEDGECVCDEEPSPSPEPSPDPTTPPADDGDNKGGDNDDNGNDGGNGTPGDKANPDGTAPTPIPQRGHLAVTG